MLLEYPNPRPEPLPTSWTGRGKHARPFSTATLHSGVISVAPHWFGGAGKVLWTLRRRRRGGRLRALSPLGREGRCKQAIEAITIKSCGNRDTWS